MAEEANDLPTMAERLAERYPARNAVRLTLRKLAADVRKGKPNKDNIAKAEKLREKLGSANAGRVLGELLKALEPATE